jgi:small-conductance mechanosensitive channel
MMADLLSKPADQAVPQERVVRRVSWLIPIFGLAAGVVAVLLHHWDWAEGLWLGSALAWLNFHWLKRGIWAFTAGAATENSGGKRHRSGATYLAAAFRYTLIGLALYAIFELLHVSLVSLAVGLCAFAAAIITATVWEIIQSGRMRS